MASIERGKRYGRYFEASLDFLEQVQYWTNDKSKDYQLEQVQRFIQSAAR
jgi:hypothetical protein